MATTSVATCDDDEGSLFAVEGDGYSNYCLALVGAGWLGRNTTSLSGGNALTASSRRRASSSNPIQRSLRINFAHSHDDRWFTKITWSLSVRCMDILPFVCENRFRFARPGHDYQDKLARFLENHDEPRAASEFRWRQHAAAAMITFLCPACASFIKVSSTGRGSWLPTDLCRRPVEPRNPEIAAFYGNLLQVLKQTPTFRDGGWAQIQPQQAWSGNWTSEDFVAYAWAGDDGSRYLVVVNYAGNQGQCRLPLLFPEYRGKKVRLTDMMGTEVYDRDGSEVVDPGLYIDHAPWQYNVFELRAT
jgi:hypothetical protein